MSVSNGFFALWITVSPSNLRCPLVLLLASVFFSIATNQTAFWKMQYYTTTINSIAVA